MASVSLRAAGIVALLAAALYQLLLRDLLTKLGVGRLMQPVGDFPYHCRRVSHEQLQACEDMWLDEDSRRLYLACSNTVSRSRWMPNIGKLDESALHMDDAIYVLDVDQPVGDGLSCRKLTTPDFRGTAGEGSLHVLSVSGQKLPRTSTVQLYLINNKPSLNPSPSTHLAKNAQTGANSTVELFQLEKESSSLRHLRTFAHPLIVSPNNVAPVPDGSGFYISNDHGLHKTGLKHALSPYLFTGNVVHCTNPPPTSAVGPTCKVVATGLSFPNGLAIHPLDPKVLYVPSANFGKGIAIFKIHPDGSLSKIQDLKVPYPIDNLSPSADGGMYAAAFPKTFDTLRHFDDPGTFDLTVPADSRKAPPATVLKITKVRNLVNDGHEVTWTWEKIIEDAHGQVLPASTTAVRDSKTGKLFMSGVLSYFITVCERR